MTLPKSSSTFYYEYYDSEGVLKWINPELLVKYSNHKGPGEIAYLMCSRIHVTLDEHQKVSDYLQTILKVRNTQISNFLLTDADFYTYPTGLVISQIPSTFAVRSCSFASIIRASLFQFVARKRPQFTISWISGGIGRIVGDETTRFDGDSSSCTAYAHIDYSSR